MITQAGKITIMSIIKVDDTALRAPSISFWARLSANLFRRPFPNPMSRLSTQTSIELIVSQTPFSYVPKHFRVSKIPQEYKDIILQIRLENKTYSEKKIEIILFKEYNIKLSHRTIGKILKELIINLPHK